MCITTELLALFITMLSPEIVSAEEDRITIHATEGDRVWVAKGDIWCTDDVAGDGVAL